MSKLKKTVMILCVALGLASCDVLTQVAQMANFANCTFNFDSVNNIQMLGTNLSKGMTRENLNISQGLALVNAIAKKSLPVTFNVNLDVKNPNSIAASMASADAIVNLAFKLAGASSNPVNVGLKVKPYISIGNQQLAYPDYLSMNKVLN